MKFHLKDLINYRDIVVQCHDNPDADALASGYALVWYLKKQDIDARFVYGGKEAVQKSNLLKMIDDLQITVEHITELPEPELLVTVDCQYGESNVTKFDANKVIVIDHHRVSGELPDPSDVRSNYGSCSTVLYELLTAEGLDINENKRLATALYYGLMTDTDNFLSICHPADRDLRDVADYNKTVIAGFRGANMSKEELAIAGKAMQKAVYNDAYRYGVIEADPCDSNILGLISDLLLEVDGVDTCVVFDMLKDGVKFSVRSETKSTKASELAKYIAGDMGGGGGHLSKAGGLLKKDLILKAGIPFSSDAIGKMLYDRMYQYHSESEIVYAGKKEEDIRDYRHYTKMEVAVGYVKAADLAAPGTGIMIRTLEGDVDVEVEEDLYIILGVDGEIYPCRQKKFESNYRFTDTPYAYPGEYPPVVIDNVGGERIPVLPYAKSCIAMGGSGIYARQLDHRVKVFTAWDPDKYYLGVEGDYLAVRADDLTDIYIIAKSVFERTYRLTEE
ncbi:MAG: DHH family phosphoesterase [Lachnospiraceae bacterium]|nr:DHH family phosphoesterase [Lachnospiraceae bacterium]